MSELKNIAIEQIAENPEAIRVVNRQGEEYIGLVDSIREKGFRGTITVRELSDGQYVVVDGMHRYMAAKDAGIPEVPCDVADMDEAAAIEYSIMGNVHRKDTKASEYRSGLLKMLNINPLWTEADLAAKLGKSPTWVQNILNLNKIESDDIMALIDQGEITMSNAYVLAKLPSDEQLNLITEAQTMSPDEFIPLATKRAKDIRDQKRKGNDPAAAEFTHAEYMQKMKDVKAQRDSGEIAAALIAETNTSDAQSGFILALNWVLHADVFSIAEQKAKWEQKQAEKKAKKKQKEAEKAAKVKAKAEEQLKKAAEAEAAIQEQAAQ